MEIDYKLIGERIREARKAKGLTQERLSEEIDVTIAFMSRIERGTSQINLKRLAQISTALDIPIEKLITALSNLGGWPVNPLQPVSSSVEHRLSSPPPFFL